MTRTLFSARCAVGAVAIAVTLIAAPPARAQIGNMLGGQLQSGSGTSIGAGSANNNFRKPALAPGIPGARSTPDRAAPADKLATDMQPTDALFDAVNRGDIAAVREALGRGAEVSARNILGLTPVDLSVDLGHTKITFLLLSMRRGAPAPDARRGTTRTATAAPAGAPAGGVHVNRAPLTAVRSDAEMAASPPPAPRMAAPRMADVRPVTPRPVAPRPAPQPRVMADDGGTPRPSAGFLGFGR
jgi:hypothetical protein